ncbi:MAG: YCF48-related protein [Blastocatellia bacterium]
MILHTSDGGTTWKRQLVTEAQTDATRNLNSLEDIHFVSVHVGWAAGYSGTILKTTDGGESWHGQASPTNAILNKIQFMDENWGWILEEEGGEILHTSDGGRKWVTYHFPATSRVSSLNFRDKFNGWIVGEKGQVFQTMDSGRTWKERGAELAAKVSGWKLRDVNFPAVRFFSEYVGFIAGGINYRYPLYNPNGVIFKTMDGGLTWKPSTTTGKLGLKFANFVSEEEAWVVPYNYREEKLLHTVDGGRNWAFVQAKPKAGIVQFGSQQRMADSWTMGLPDHQRPYADERCRTDLV